MVAVVLLPPTKTTTTVTRKRRFQSSKGDAQSLVNILGHMSKLSGVLKVFYAFFFVWSCHVFISCFFLSSSSSSSTTALFSTPIVLYYNLYAFICIFLGFLLLSVDAIHNYRAFCLAVIHSRNEGFCQLVSQPNRRQLSRHL